MFEYNGKICISTHGGAGYATGSYWDGYDIICGSCGERIINPYPTGGEWISEPGFWNTILNKKHYEDRWPDFIMGKRGVKYNRSQLKKVE